MGIAFEQIRTIFRIFRVCIYVAYLFSRSHYTIFRIFFIRVLSVGKCADSQRFSSLSIRTHMVFCVV